MIKLGVNIDHIATLRQARKTIEPDPVAAAVIAELAGADGITVHLREDRRHINDRDIALLRKVVRTRLNLEMSIAKEIVGIAMRVKPDQATLVPEKRQEITTEGGLNVAAGFKKIKEVTGKLQKNGIIVSLFVDPEEEQIRAASKVKAEFIELHTGMFAKAKNGINAEKELDILEQSAKLAKSLGLRVNAGHGLDYWNTKQLVQKIPDLEELNIGHAIIARAVLVGLDKAVGEMKALIDNYANKV
ncbi:MAG: pyridoxine 5'-phosphate synthase [Candidatus Omnitrophica bacterium]|nr:pyridoxine 5'-phosphate synthase [Candidatus Omnitrophota bacterium]